MSTAALSTLSGCVLLRPMRAGLLLLSTIGFGCSTNTHRSTKSANNLSPSVAQRNTPGLRTTTPHGLAPGKSGSRPGKRAGMIQTPARAPSAAIDLPPHTWLRLPNGLRILALPDQRLPLINIELHLRVGSIDDPTHQSGLSKFTTRMLRQGIALSGRRKVGADTLSERIDAAGATLSITSGYELSSLGCRGRKSVVRLCLSTVSDLVQHPTFPAKEFREIEEQLIGAIRESRDDPATLAALHFKNLLFGDNHPSGRSMSERSIKSINRSDVQRFHRLHFNPKQAVLVVSGAIDLAALKKDLNRYFSRWRGVPIIAPKIEPVSNPTRGFRLLIIDKPELSQSFFTLGHIGVKRQHPDRDAIRLMNFILGGGGFSSRLMQRIRSEGGKTYGIVSRFSTSQADGSFFIRTFTRNAEIVATLKLVREEMKRLHTRPPSAAEIEAAKGNLAGGYAIGFRKPGSLAAKLARSALRGYPETYTTELALRLDAVKANQVRKVSARHIRPDSLVGAIVGPATTIAPALKAAGYTIEVISFTDPISAGARKNAAKN